MEESLTNKTFIGVWWNAIDNISNYGVSFIVSIVLARLLGPEEYGLIGIILIFISLSNVILDGGFSTALIRKEFVEEKEYNTVFYTNIIVSLVLIAFLFGGAPIIADFFHRSELIDLTRVISVILIIDAVSVTQQALLIKKIDFKTLTKISLASHVISGFCGICLAYYGMGVWALVAQQLSNKFSISILLCYFNKWYPKLEFSWGCFKDLFGFSWKLLVSRVATVFLGNIYNAVIGRIYTPQALGLYTRATQYGQMFSSGIADVVLKVSLPVMSTIQSDNERLIHGTRIIIKETMFVTFVLMMLLVVIARPLIYVLIGEKWLDCVPFLQIVSFNLMMNPLCYINENLLAVKGRSDKLLLIKMNGFLTTVIAIAFGVIFDIYCMLICSAILSWLSLLLFTYYTGKYFDYKWYHQLKDILPSLTISISVAIPVFFIGLIPLSYFAILPLQIGSAFCLLLAICEIGKMEEYIYLKTIILSKISRNTNKYD